ASGYGFGGSQQVPIQNYGYQVPAGYAEGTSDVQPTRAHITKARHKSMVPSNLNFSAKAWGKKGHREKKKGLMPEHAKVWGGKGHTEKKGGQANRAALGSGRRAPGGGTAAS